MKHKPITFSTKELIALLELINKRDITPDIQFFDSLHNAEKKLFVSYFSPQLQCKNCKHAEPASGRLYKINIECPIQNTCHGAKCKACKHFEPADNMQLDEIEASLIFSYKKFSL